jgi:hyperosmotically inducible protein
MFRALLRLIVVLVVIVAAAAFFLGYWGSGRLHTPTGPAMGTSGHIDAERARDAGAKVGEKTAEAANRAGVILAEGALTAKIKSKMALDDTVKARTIEVSTTGHVVTLSGTVRSEAEHARVLQLARETAGVTQVIDRVSIDRK